MNAVVPNGNEPERGRPQVLYLPGLGADHRLTEMLAMNEDSVESVTPDYIPWRGGESLRDYARRFFHHLVASRSIEPERLRHIVGISLGGAIALEIAELLSRDASRSIERVALVGSFRMRSELAGYVRLGARWIAPYVPDFVYRILTPVVPLILNGVSRVPRESISLLQSMYASMPQHFFARACRAIASWEADVNIPDARLFRIHGEDDHIIPIENTSLVDVTVKGAKHLVSVSHTESVREALRNAL